MCTSLSLPLPNGRRLFGRTLDLDCHFGEQLTLTPRCFPFIAPGGRALPGTGARPGSPQPTALLGMATVVDGYPLYAEAMNETGLSVAGLRFAGNAHYLPPEAPAPAGYARVELAPWELIPYLLTTCRSVAEARRALGGVRVVDIPFPARSGPIPPAPLHWHISDREAAAPPLVLEVSAAGHRLYEDPVGVLANNPPFPFQLAAYARTLAPKADAAIRRVLREQAGVEIASLGEVGGGIPGDYSSPARYLRAAHLGHRVAAYLQATACGPAAPSAPPAGPQLPDPVELFFSVMAAVSPMAGAVPTPDGGWHRTLYTLCMDPARGRCHVRGEGLPAPRSVAFGELCLSGSSPTVL